MSFLFLRQGVAMLFIAPCIYADIYQWRDSHGQMHFSDRAPDSSEAVSGLQEIPPEGPGLNIYQAVIPDITDESADREARNKARLSEKKRQRLNAEKAMIADAERDRKCRKARDDYRFGEGRYRATPGLDDLRKARRRIDAIKERIRRYCYQK